MPRHHRLSRREFLKIVGTTASAAALGGCMPIPKVTPAATPKPTPEEVEPIVPEMVLVEAGSFQMGSTDGDADEQPVHTVHITRPFYIAKYAVTFEEYDRFCDDTIGIVKPDDGGRGRGNLPVINVTWYDAVAYCNWLSEKEGLTPCYSGKGRLNVTFQPTAIGCPPRLSGSMLLMEGRTARGTSTLAATTRTTWRGMPTIRVTRSIP